MPMRQFLDNPTFDPEATRVMGVAFEMVRAALGLADRGDLANEIVAKRIIELAKAGERNPDRLCEEALKDIRRPQQWAASEAAKSSVLRDSDLPPDSDGTGDREEALP